MVAPAAGALPRGGASGARGILRDLSGETDPLAGSATGSSWGFSLDDRHAGLRHAGLAPAVAALVCLAAAGGGCSSVPKPERACLEFRASPNLNLYDGQAHALTVYLFPLASSVGFERTPPEDLLGGATPPGVLGGAVHLTIAPGEEEREFEDLFPASTAQIGVVADYYRAPGDPEGTRMQVVPARCGWRTPELTLTAKDIYLE
jgi:type VI secretion system VasD/TssJ family lipoprotein